MTKSKDGLTAWEAIRLLSPEPEIAQAHMIKSDLEELYSGGTTWVDAEYDERLGQALRPGLPVLLDRLADGTWYAMGLRTPLDPNKQCENIPAHLWGALDISPDDNTVSGSGLEYEDVLYYEGKYERRPTAAPAPSATPFKPRPAGRKKGSGSNDEPPEPGQPEHGPSAVRPNRRGRKEGIGGYDSKDMPLIEEMHRFIEIEEVTGPWNAALKVVDKAPGSRNIDSRLKRLTRKYAAKYGPGEGLSD